jgi:cytochrome b6-f complex iron-sulfur subunit
MRPRQSSRREFLCLGVASVACACSGCGGSSSRQPSVVARPAGGRLSLSKAESAPLLQPRSSLLVQPEGVRDKILVVNRDGSLSALSAICTHMGCTVNYDEKSGRMHCPCHGSEFAPDGSNVKGPAKRPLKRYAVTMENGQLVIAL